MSKRQPPHKSTKRQTSPDDNLSARAHHTWPQPRPSTTMERATKAARVRTLTDPLGAKGFRATGKRVRTETVARRKVLLASVATFAASFGIIVGTNHLPANADSSAATNQPAATTASNGQAVTNNASSVGAAADLFSGQTANGLTDIPTPTPTAAATKRQHDDGETDDENSSSLTTQSNSNSSSSGQVGTSNQTGQSSLFQQSSVQQQPSHTRSGGS